MISARRIRHDLTRTTHPLTEWWWTVDRLLLAAMVALMLTRRGAVAGGQPARWRPGSGSIHFTSFNRHVLFLLPSFIVMIGVSFLSPRQIRRSALIVFALSVVLIVATLWFGSGGQGRAALDHPDRRQHPGFGIRQARLRGAGGVAVCGIRRAGPKCRRPRWRWRCC